VLEADREDTSEAFEGVVNTETTPPLPPPAIRDDASMLFMLEFTVFLSHKSVLN
jgi:hypothetical protein